MRKSKKTKRIRWPQELHPEAEPEFVPIDSVEIADPCDVREQVDSRLVSMAIDEQLDTLCDREKRSLIARYYDEMTLEAVGKKFGISTERIRQIIAKALRKMRHPTRRISLRMVRDHLTREEAEAKEFEAEREIEKQLQERYAKAEETRRKREEKERRKKEKKARRRKKHLASANYIEKQRRKDLKKKVCPRISSHDRLYFGKKIPDPVATPANRWLNRQDLWKKSAPPRLRNTAQLEFERRSGGSMKPPDICELRRDCEGKPYIYVPPPNYFVSTTGIYQVWLDYLILKENKESKND